MTGRVAHGRPFIFCFQTPRGDATYKNPHRCRNLSFLNCLRKDCLKDDRLAAEGTCHAPELEPNLAHCYRITHAHFTVAPGGPFASNSSRAGEQNASRPSVWSLSLGESVFISVGVQKADLIYVKMDVSRHSQWRTPQTRHRGFSAVKPRSGMGNRLLAALPAPELDLLEPELEVIALDQDAVLSQAGDDIEYVIFPHSGAITLMIDMADGHTVATAAIGREGAVGILSVLGPSPSATTAVVRAAGTASRIPASRFHGVFNRSPAIRRMVQNHVKAMLMQFQLGLACNALHPVEARMARWLLQLRDRVDHDTLPLTQHALSQMLGVRRTTVTLLMRNLRARGAIRSDRRGLIEIDPARLEAAACECHNAMRLEVEEIFSTNSAQSRAAILPAIKSRDAV